VASRIWVAALGAVALAASCLSGCRSRPDAGVWRQPGHRRQQVPSAGSRQQQIDDNCLGWDCSVAGQAGYRGKYDGIGDPGSAGLQILFGILAGTIPVVIATNSNGPALQTVVQTALRTATSPR
jgi:hypothetical protein